MGKIYQRKKVLQSDFLLCPTNQTHHCSFTLPRRPLPLPCTPEHCAHSSWWPGRRDGLEGLRCTALVSAMGEWSFGTF